MSTKNHNRQLQGARAKVSGLNFETIIDVACEYYRKRSLAEIDKTPEPMRPIQGLGGGRFIAFYEKHAQPDYKGAMIGGRAVMFEAKHSDGDRIAQNRVTEAQAAALSRQHQIGAVCFILVSLGFLDYFRIPWTEWSGMKEIYGRKYLTVQEMEPFKITYKCGVLHFLNGLLESEDLRT